MINNIGKHAGYYISLVAILVLGFILASISSSYRELQIGIAALTTMFYVLWGILHHLTAVTNKHLLPIYNKPMIYYPLEAMGKAGIKEVLITTSPHHAGEFTNLLSSGEEFGLKLYYAIQKNPTG